MSSEPEKPLPSSRARRHFLGVVLATGGRVAALSAAATALHSLPAQAMGNKWWNRPGGDKGSGDGDGGNCFLRGTSIRTPEGETRIEDLKIGDLVETVRGQAVAIKWIGRRTYTIAGPSVSENITPIRIARHALDDKTPEKDLYLSPNHALLIDGVLIRVKELVNGMSITRTLPAGQKNVEYFHVVLDKHEVIFAEGAPAESFLMRESNHEAFENFAEYERLYPAHSRTPMAPFAPFAGYESGREHLKALLLLGVSPFIQLRDPIQDAYKRIATRAAQPVS
ncbi:Hint domain-containing protein [Phyllobacterium endophyticum]|uniref:Hedgehog/Intein (Hint) domain-containing protein n=1 Tax=Phyllobacterium endophyticum TaxID=1149773 RepID=A0A2P7AX48_9HYPH|nr:Hint domain-containing protein [Phyllobacterium endophyticum]MBB3234523.1 hypothetical protein [Phyllobacterium endophyticum]PSH58765.1 hypothetical protein CU100_10095 [Phyllobacterium endophyticum]TYR38677.1 Hint domain-containing protein [Phyllobacterium endophyticum]